MTQVNIDDAGNLRFVFKENIKDNVVIVYKLVNTGELEFIDDECVGLELLNFEQQLNRGKIDDVFLYSTEVQDDTFVFHIGVNGQPVNGRIDFSSIKE